MHSLHSDDGYFSVGQQETRLASHDYHHHSPLIMSGEMIKECAFLPRRGPFLSHCLQRRVDCHAPAGHLPFQRPLPLFLKQGEQDAL